MGLIPSFPMIHFDFGAIKELAPELENYKISNPLFLTDQGVVEHGILKKIDQKALDNDIDWMSEFDLD